MSKPAPYFTLRFSPDGRRLALGIQGKGLDTYAHDLTPDGKHIVFQCVSGDSQALLWVWSDGAGDMQKLPEGTARVELHSISPDGRHLADQQGANANLTSGRCRWMCQTRTILRRENPNGSRILPRTKCSPPFRRTVAGWHLPLMSQAPMKCMSGAARVDPSDSKQANTQICTLFGAPLSGWTFLCHRKSGLLDRQTIAAIMQCTVRMCRYPFLSTSLLLNCI